MVNGYSKVQVCLVLMRNNNFPILANRCTSQSGRKGLFQSELKLVDCNLGGNGTPGNPEWYATSPEMQVSKHEWC